MTNILVEKGKETFKSIVCDGHTGFGQSGEDIVCAALSSIVQTSALGMLTVAGANISIVRDDENGYMKIVVPEGLDLQVAHDVEVIFQTMMCGIYDLYEQYSDFIELEVKDVY